MSETVLLTGATGFLGMEVLARLIEREDADVVCLVRAPSAEAATARIAGVLERLYEQLPAAAARVSAVAGDVSSDDLGLEGKVRADLLERVTSVVHCAAAISFDLALEETRRVNTLGAVRMIEFAHQIAARGRLRRYVHVSTAYVAGRHEGIFREQDLDLGQGFRNTYEQSKFEGEQGIRAIAGDLPLVIARPSIVVGDSATGWTPVFNVIYWPLRAFSRGLLDHIPVDPSGIVDIVSVDYVADSLIALLEHPQADGVVHLVAGASAPTNAQLIELACHHFGRPAPTLSLDGSDTIAEAGVYLPYFGIQASLDDVRARAILEPLGLSAAPLRDYFPVLIEYAELARWGKRPLSREAAAHRIAV
jgi:thioester reductase-like protein